MPASNIIEIILRVVDQATAGIQTVSKSVNDLGSRISRSLGGMSVLTKRLLAFAGVGSGVFLLHKAFSQMFASIRENEDAVAQLEAGIKSTGGAAGYTVEQLQSMAAELQNVTAFGDEAINQMQSVLLTFTKIRGDQFKEATLAVANLASRLKVDLQAAALQVGKALNDPVLGVSMLSRAGIQFTATQKKMIKELVEANKFVEAQKIVLKELETQFGGSAAAARQTFSGALQAVKNRFADLFEAGKDVVGPATKSLNELEDVLNSPQIKAGFQSLLSFMLSVVSTGAQVISTIGEFIGGLRILAAEVGLIKAADKAEQLRIRIADLESQLVRLEDPSWWVTLGLGAENITAKVKQLKAALAEAIREQNALNSLGPPKPGTAAAPKPPPIAAVLQPDVEDRIQKAIQSTETSLQKQRRVISENIAELKAFVGQYEKLTAEQRDQAGVSEELFNGARRAIGALNRDLKQLGDEQRKVVDELEIQSVAATKALRDMQTSYLRDTQTTLQAASQEWLEYIGKLEALRQANLINPSEYESRLADFLDNKFSLATKAKGVIDQLRTPIERIDDQFREMRRSLNEYLDFLTTHGGDTSRIEEVQAALDQLPKAYNEALEKAKQETNQWIAFQEEAAKRLQAAFSDAFMEIGHGWRKFLLGIATALQQILSEAITLQVVKLFKLDEVIKKGVGAIFGGKTEQKPLPGLSPEEARAEAQRRVEQIKQHAEQVAAVKENAVKVSATIDQQTSALSNVIAANDPCACPVADRAGGVLPLVDKIVQPAQPSKEIAKAVDQVGSVIEGITKKGPEAGADQTPDVIKSTSKNTQQSVGKTVDKASGEISGSTLKIGKDIVGAVLSSAASGRSSDLFGQILGSVITYAMTASSGRTIPAFAGGGKVPQIRVKMPAMPISKATGGLVPVKVGEEGPETVLLPGGSKVVNQRQMAYAGGGGQTVNYQPIYHINITGTGEADDTQQKLAAYLIKRDAQLKRDIMETLRENGFGRMR